MAQNHLITLLPRADRVSLQLLCASVPLVAGSVLCEPGNPTQHVYFPMDGFVALVGLNDGSPDLEVGMIGREGMLGATVALGVATAPMRLVVQGAGSALRLGSGAFRAELARSADLQRCVHRYIYVLMAQMASCGACHRFHPIEPRLARWLLMTQDRTQSDQFQVTQELLAYRLGVRRVGITHAAGALQRAGLIEYHRGDMRVLDRVGLKAAACGCYTADLQAYAALL